MSTHSNIRIRRKDGTETGIYCHSDGYTELNGLYLQLGYNTAEKVEELLKLGDLSQLGLTLDTCVAYHRDRGEGFSQTLEDAEYVYWFDESEAVWKMSIEEYTNDTEALRLLGLRYDWLRYEVLLLDDILKLSEVIDDPDFWHTDEFAESGKVSEACIAKAQEARAKLLEEKRLHDAAYYDAYYV